ncbi:hypothetical protein [Endozoicomonas euniceicola]|uniref:Uncharacterized protein n=1 Tax=Endozoicomonas euniceicola TaxID=1234143 RepID=A0ABY6GXF8_9GAMM|nr:hypothetical protein [Endozoicomonas euniceicola]UYM17252.1 hypothetical protein NX720_04835 [Endozoicomonas euniceicola]
MSGLFFLSISLASLSAMANPVITDSGHGIVFDASCPNGEKVCENHPVDCLGGCALNATTGATVFQWERTIFETQLDKSLRVDIQGMKKCLSRDAVREALLKAQEQTPGTGAEKLPCTVKGSVWRYIYPKYTVSLLAKDTCDTAGDYLNELTGSCQDWKNSVNEGLLLFGYAFAGVAAAIMSYFITAQIGRCIGCGNLITIGDILVSGYTSIQRTCRGYAPH